MVNTTRQGIFGLNHLATLYKGQDHDFTSNLAALSVLSAFMFILMVSLYN